MFNRNQYNFLLIIFLYLAFNSGVSAQTRTVFDPELNKTVETNEPTEARTIRYTPDGQSFVIVNGKNKFNRALYGTHTGFRVETGDVPEFALYLPRMGGNLSFSLGNKKKEINLNDFAKIKSIYNAGSRVYELEDADFTGKGKIMISVLAMNNAEGMILKIDAIKMPAGTQLNWIFGGCADKRFSREGDLGVDPKDCFDLKPEYCKGNEFTIHKNSFQVIFGAKKDRKLVGIFPEKSRLTIDAAFPALKGQLNISGSKTYYIAIQIPDSTTNFQNISNIFSPLSHQFEPELKSFTTQKISKNKGAKAIYNSTDQSRAKIASQLKIETSDPYFNTLGGTLAMAADGIWSGETWLHGAVGWRMPLSGWRAAYTGDVLGWHDRARQHFDAYAASQVTKVVPFRMHPTQDSALNLARAEKSWGTQMYSNGYICRNPNRNDQMHHYDMNLCYIDELLWHLNWTGDMDYARKMWPVITSHLAWEKRNFDPDNDGLYDAYCCIWASDALYYNSGAVTHSSAYNYRANKIAAEIAEKIGENSGYYRMEADKILKAINSRMWLSEKGHWAEFQDFMGEKKLHESAAVWTIYHSIDSDIHDAFQGYQAMRYVDTEIPHIPVIAEGLEDGFATISTSNWMPYSWSINNVAFAEVMHTSLAYWQAGRNEEGFKLLKSSVLDGMYMGASPGNVGQISYYDAARGECYRDFGDPIGVMSRALVQGLFGIQPDAMNGQLILRPGFPQSWDHASIQTSDIKFSFARKNNSEKYIVEQHFKNKLRVDLRVKITDDKILSVTVNGKYVEWKIMESSIEFPIVSIEVPPIENAEIEIITSGRKLSNHFDEIIIQRDSVLSFKTEAEIMEIFDPQNVVALLKNTFKLIQGKVTGAIGYRTLFVKLRQGEMLWWQPLKIKVEGKAKPYRQPFVLNSNSKLQMIELESYFNDSVTNIFKNKYLSPRSPYTTLQIPTQGIGEWCHPLTTAEIDDAGLRGIAAKNNNVFSTNLKIDFKTPAIGKNIANTSRWDNFPRKIEIPLTGMASNAFLMLAGTTNHMQTHFVNGLIVAEYMDGTSDTLQLINPDNWCPIEQDYYVDGKAFRLDAPRPYRVHLKTGLVSNDLEKELKIDGVYGRKIDGGAGVLLDMPLNKNKKLHKITLETVANDVIIGLMSLTLQR